MEENIKALVDKITVFTHSSICIDAGIGKIYVDPFDMKEAPQDGTYILATHEHYDHFSPQDIAKVAAAESVLIVPDAMRAKAQPMEDFVGEIFHVRPGHDRTIYRLPFKCVPAYNIAKKFHPKDAGWVGYILEIDDLRVYIAGDTDATDEAKNVKCDIALVPIGGTYTMDAKEAAELINTIKPKVAIPTHYGNIVGKLSDADEFAKNVDPEIEVVIKIQA